MTYMRDLFIFLIFLWLLLQFLTRDITSVLKNYPNNNYTVYNTFHANCIQTLLL